MSHSLAIAYAMKKKAKRMANGGSVDSDTYSSPDGGIKLDGPGVRSIASSFCEGGELPYDKHRMAEGGFVSEEEASAYGAMPEERREHMYEHAEENQGFPEEEDLVGRIMKSRAKHYSKGGQVANDTEVEADFEPDQFDDLVKDDHLKEHYSAANSGDEIGNKQEDEDERDIVARIMKQRRLKDHLPHPM